MEDRLLLDVVTTLQLLAGEERALLIWRDTASLDQLGRLENTTHTRYSPLLVLDLSLDAVGGVRRLDFKGDGLAREGPDEDLHASTETEDEMGGRLLLDVVIRMSMPVLELLASGDQPLLVWRDTRDMR